MGFLGDARFSGTLLIRKVRWRTRRRRPAQDNLQPLHPLRAVGVSTHLRRRAPTANDRRDPSQGHRTAASLLKKGLFPDVSGARKAA